MADYQQVARDYNLSSSQKKQYFHSLLRGDAKRFYLHRFYTQVTTFTQAIQLIVSDYNSIVRKSRGKTFLSTSRLSKFVTEGPHELAALEKAYKLIAELSPQVPVSHRGETHKIEFLRNETVGYK